MSNVILLSDNMVFGDYGTTRYMGPYVIASQLEKSSISCLVIDYFTRCEDFFNYLEPFLTTDTLILGISSTFLFPLQKDKSLPNHRSVGVDNYYTGELWLDNGEELQKWLAELKKLLLRKSPGCKIVLGGVKSQFAHWRPQFYQDIDYVIFGAADEVIIDLYKKIQNQETPPLLKNLNHHVVDTNKYAKRNALCPKTDFRTSRAIGKNESLPIEISRGCLYNCKFCHYEKKESYKKNSEDIKEEFIKNYERFGTTVYHFCDDCFNDTRKKVEDVCNAILSLPFKIDWVSYARFDVAVKFPETVDLMIASGARGLYMGIESFHHQVALRAGKGTPPEKVKEFLLDFKKKYSSQCLIEGSFIIGLPGETKENLEHTSQWLEENDALDFATFGPLGLMPYNVSLDGTVFDFADYSRNPEKYGFRNVSFKPNYWEHETMNSKEASTLASQMVEKWRSKNPPGIIKTIWMYPHLRTLGMTHEDIFFRTRARDDDAVFALNIKNRFNTFLKNYFKQLQDRNYGHASFPQQSL